MADKIDVQVTGKSEAEIAYMLFRDVAVVEGKSLHQGVNAADRAYIIKTFAECMAVVKYPQNHL
jgi:hypothetical protein